MVVLHWGIIWLYFNNNKLLCHSKGKAIGSEAEIVKMYSDYILKNMTVSSQTASLCTLSNP